jgi:hypothetical protein
LEEMKAAGVEPTAAAYTRLLTAYKAGGQEEQARAVRQEMEAAEIVESPFRFKSREFSL